MASCADGLGTVLGLQLRGYQVERDGCGEGEKKGGERERERDRGRKNSAKQILSNMLKDKHGRFAFMLEAFSQEVNTFLIFSSGD